MTCAYNRESQLADLDTPISIYLKLRDHFERVVLLESNDFRSADNSHSYICCDALHSIRVSGDRLTVSGPEDTRQRIVPVREMLEAIKEAASQISCTGSKPDALPVTGYFGYFAYDAVRYFETIDLSGKGPAQIPDIALDFFRYVIAFDHFRQSIHIIEHQPAGQPSGIPLIRNLINRTDILHTPFHLTGPLRSNMTDDEYMSHVRKGKEHCQQGDVFQVVLSRRFDQDFRGDNFNVYRALRRINPSPYLFYFDYGQYQLFGSSPESQLVIHDGMARIHPIAGTYRRTGDEATDQQAAAALLKDEKELSEHTMLVDLARNDLNRHADNVQVAAYREIHHYSHVMHIISEVCGHLRPGIHALDAFAGCFPAGTLSGAPKYRAMEIIHEREPTRRSYYGGAIGFFDLDHNMNTAIMIRSFLSQGNTLTMQAGAGIVVSSDPGRENAEVKHKLQALVRALEEAAKTTIHEAAPA
ncbi:MAG: anthranilate synthase component I family protein [Saprospiraceae bacterium]|nr:anthranilate synthase component I family protein [Saprospiraceae bacterium]